MKNQGVVWGFCPLIIWRIGRSATKSLRGTKDSKTMGNDRCFSGQRVVGGKSKGIESWFFLEDLVRCVLQAEQSFRSICQPFCQALPANAMSSEAGGE